MEINRTWELFSLDTFFFIPYTQVMTIRLRTVFFAIVTILAVWFLFAERGILTPFIAGGIFAYIFNPVVGFFSERLKLPRIASVILVYVLLIGIFVGLGFLLSRQLFSDPVQVQTYEARLLRNARFQIDVMPVWLRPTLTDLLKTLTSFQTQGPFSLALYAPQALGKLISFLIFLVSSFYFLKDGNRFVLRVIAYMPHEFKKDMEELAVKINHVLGGYLRGQVFLIFLMSLWTYLALAIIGVRFALVIGLISGFAEIIPVVGPIVAASLAVVVVLLTGTTHFGLTSVNAAVIVILVYFFLRQIEDYFVIPHIMGRITKLPPFIIFFAVIAGGHLGGVLGLILAVPVVAVIKIFLEYSVERVNMKHKH